MKNDYFDKYTDFIGFVLAVVELVDLGKITPETGIRLIKESIHKWKIDQES